MLIVFFFFFFFLYQASTSPSAFSTNYYNVTLRARTTASTTWNVQGWQTANDRMIAQQSADVTKIVQELVTKSTWVSGSSSIAFLFERDSGTGSRWASSGSTGTGYPQLQIVYNAGKPHHTVPKPFFFPILSKTNLLQHLVHAV
jgi:hypothetical protein